MRPNVDVIETPGTSDGGTNTGTLSGLNGASLQVSPSTVLTPPNAILNGSAPTGTTLLSSNGRFQATFQADGNLVVRDTTKTGAAAIIWASGTDGKSAGGTLAVQADGNLVIYGVDGRADWDTETSHDDDVLGPRDYQLIMESNGNLTLYDVNVGLPLWVNGERIARGDELAGNWSDTRSLEYIASYPDLMNRLGSDDDRGRSHFNSSGIGEDRVTTFNAANYLAANPDLSEAFGTDTERAAEHWIDQGRYEGRALAPGEAPQDPVPALSFEDASGNGRGTVTLPHGDGEITDERIENYTEYSLTGRGTVELSDGRRFVVERDEGVPFPAQDLGPSLTSGHLETNQSITSENGRYQAVFQTDGNFVLYDLDHPDGRTAIWATGTQGDAELGIVAMQKDGNLVVYDSFQKNTLPENAEWSSATHHEDGEANRDFTLTLGNDGQLSVTDSENNGAVLWTSGGGHIQDAPGIPRATASEIRPDDAPRDPLASEPFLINGEVFVPDIPDGAEPADYQEAVIQLMTWLTTGFISNDQFNNWSNDLEVLSGLQQIIENGGGRFDVVGEVELDLRASADMTTAEIATILDAGFDLEQGPSAEQLTALNTLAKGNDSAFIEVLTAFTLKHHPDLDLRFSYGGVNNGGRHGQISFGGPEEQTETPFVSWLEERFEVFDSGLKNQFTQMEYTTREGRYTRTHTVIDRDDDGDYRGSASLTPSFNVIRDISTEAEAQNVYDIFGVSAAFGDDPTLTGRGALIGDDGRTLGYSFSVTDNKNQDLFEGFGSNMVRDAIENFDPTAIGGTTTFLINATNETVANVSDLGNMTVIEQGGSGNTVLAGAGDLIYSTTGATGGILRPGGGDLLAIADDSNTLRIEDVVDRADNATVVRYTGDNTGTFQFTDDGVNAVTIEEGTTKGFVIQANGTIQVELASGADVSDSMFLFNGADGTFLAQDGSSLTSSIVFGGEERDNFIFNGNVEGTYVRTNGGNDYIEIGENFTGGFDVRDNAASWMWQNGDEVFENDTVVIRGSVSEGMQEEGWTLVEGQGDAPDKLVHYDEPDAEGNRAILAQVTLSGDSERIENIVVADGEGNFTSLQEVPPEVRSKLAALGLISSVLMVVGAVFPPAAIAGAVLKFTYDAANNNLSFQNALLTAASVAGAGNGIGGVGGGNAIAPAWVAPALSAGANVLDGDWANFTKNLFLTGAGIQAEKLIAAQDALALAEGADVANAVSTVEAAANPTIQFAKLAEGTEAAIMTVEGLTSADGWELAEGVFLLGASVAGDGSRQLLLGGADAAKIGAAIESGSLSAITSATAGFLSNQGIFNQQASFIQDTPLLTPFEQNLVVGTLNGVSTVLGIDEAIGNGDSYGQALVEAFPGILETATNFTGQNPIQVFFADINGEVMGRNPFGQNEQLVVVYDPDAPDDAPVPTSIHGNDGHRIGEIEMAADGSYNFFLPDAAGEQVFAFNHTPGTNEAPTEVRSPTQSEVDAAEDGDWPAWYNPGETGSTLIASLETSALLADVDIENYGPLTPEQIAALTSGELALYQAIVGKYQLSGAEEANLYADVFVQLNDMTQAEVDDFVRDVFSLAETEGLAGLTGQAAGLPGDGFIATGFLGELWNYGSGGPVSEKIESAFGTVYEEGGVSIEALTSFHMEDFTLPEDALVPDVIRLVVERDDTVSPDALANIHFLDGLVGSVGNESLLAEYNNGVISNALLNDQEFLVRLDGISKRIGEEIDPVALYENGEAYQLGLLNGDLAGIRELSQLDPESPEFQARLQLMVVNVGLGSGADFLTTLLADPGKFISGAAVDILFEAAFPPAELIELGFVGFEVAAGAGEVARGKDLLNQAQTPAEREEALVIIRGGTQLVTDQLANFFGSSLAVGSITNAPNGRPGSNKIDTLSQQALNDISSRITVNPDGTATFDDVGFVPPTPVDGTPDDGAANEAAPDETAPVDTPPAEPVITQVTENIVSGTVTTTGEADVVQVEYVDADGNTRSFDLLAGTTPAQASEVLEYRYLRGELDGLVPGSDPLTLVDGQTVDVIQANGGWYARVGDDVTALNDAVTRDEATAQIRSRGADGTLEGVGTVRTNDEALIGGSDTITPYSVALQAPSETDAGGITATYIIGAESYTVDVPGDQAVSYEQAQAWLTDQLEQGDLPGLLPTADRQVTPVTETQDPQTPPDEVIPNDTPTDTPEPSPEQTITEPEDTADANTPPPDAATETEPSTEGTGGNDDNGGTPPPVDTGGTPENDGEDSDGTPDVTPEDTTAEPIEGVENDVPVIDPRFAPVQPTDADGNVIPRVAEGDLVVIQPDGSKSCGQHACSMVFDTLGQPVDVDSIISTNPTTNDAGTSIADMDKLISDYGVDGETTFIIDVAELREATAGGRPVIAQVEIREDVFHYVVVDGVTEVDGQEVVAIRDSLGQTGDGVYYETTDSFFRDRRFTALAIRFDANVTPDATTPPADGDTTDQAPDPQVPSAIDPDPAPPPETQTVEQDAPQDTEDAPGATTNDDPISDPVLPVIESNSPQDIASITPPPDLNATNTGGGRRDWSEAELQAIRDYRAENDGALPDGVGLADLPTSFLQEIADAEDVQTPDSSAIDPVETSITLPDDWTTEVPGLTQGQQATLADTFTQLDISDPYARVDIAAQVVAGQDVTAVSLNAAGGLRASPEASTAAPLTEAQTAQIDALVGDSPTLNSSTNRGAIETRVRNGMSVTDAVNSVSTETNVLLTDLQQSDIAQQAPISEANLVMLDDIFVVLPGLSEGEQVAIERRVADGLTPLEATADYLAEARSIRPEPAGNSLLAAIETNEDAAGITDPGQIKFSVRLPGFPASVEYSQTSQIYTDALTGSLQQSANDNAVDGTPLPTFSDFAQTLGDLRAQQSQSVEGSDPNGVYGDLRTPGDNVLQTEIRGRYEPYRQRIVDRALEAAPYLQGNPGGGTAFIDGSDYGITNLSRLQVTPSQDGEGRTDVTFLSLSDVDLNQGREVLDTLFVEAQQASPEDAMDKIAEFAWVYYQVAPYTNGTAAIGQWAITSLMNSYGADYTALNPGVALDLEAIASSREGFIERFPTFFDGYQPPLYRPSDPVVLEDATAPIDEDTLPVPINPVPPADDIIPPADLDDTAPADIEELPTSLEDIIAPIDEDTPPPSSDPVPPVDDTIPPAGIEELPSGSEDIIAPIDEENAPTNPVVPDPVEEGTPPGTGTENTSQDETGQTPDEVPVTIPAAPQPDPIDITTFDPDPVVEPIADVDLADLDFDDPGPVDLRNDPGDLVLAPDGTIVPPQLFDFSNFGEPLRAPEIGETIPAPPFNPAQIVLDAANQGIDAGRNAAVQALDAVGGRLLETGGFQWLIDQPALYNDISSSITYDENGNATIDTTQLRPDVLDWLSDARLDPRLSVSLGTSLPIVSSPGVGSVSVFVSPRTVQRLRRDFPQLMQAFQGGDMPTVRRILGEAFGLSGDALQGLLDPQVTNTVLQEMLDRGLEGLPLPPEVTDALDNVAIGRNGYFLIKTNTLESSGAFESQPNGGWQLTGREIQQTELADMPALNSAGRPTRAGDFVLDVDLPLDEAALQAKIGPLFTHTEYSRGDLETLGLTLTIPAGTPIPGSLYSFINARIQNPVNIATFSSPGVAFENSQRIYIRARDFEFRPDKLDDQPVTRNMIEETLLHLNGLDDPAFLVTGDLATASASILSLRSPFSFSLPGLGSVKFGFTLYSRSQAQGNPEDGRLDVDPLNVGLELYSAGSEFALSIENPKRVAAFQFDDVDNPTTIEVETVDVDTLLDENGAPPAQSGGISVIAMVKSDGQQAFVPAPDTLISVLQGEPLTDRARNETAAFLALYAASPDTNIRDGAIVALDSLANDTVGEPVDIETSIAIGQLLQDAANANRIPELPTLPQE